MEYHTALKRNEILASYNMDELWLYAKWNRQKEKILRDYIYECDTAIYNKKHMLDLHSLFLNIANPSSWDLSIESHNGVFYYVNEMTFGKFLKMRAGCPQPTMWLES